MDKIGFIGLGRMGKPMASNLSKKGYELVVHDVNAAAVDELVSLGARKRNVSMSLRHLGVDIQ